MINYNKRNMGWVSALGQALDQAGILLLILVMASGCRTMTKQPGAVIGPFYKPTNYHLAGGEMPVDMRRVALLPLTSALDTREHQSGRAILQETLHTQVAHAGLFEVVTVPPSKMEALTGKPAWRIACARPLVSPITSTSPPSFWKIGQRKDYYDTITRTCPFWHSGTLYQHQSGT